MRILKNSFLLAFFLLSFSTLLLAEKSVKTKKDYYKKEMKSQQIAIQKHFYDHASGYYFVELEPSKRETKHGYFRNYTYLWSLCALYQATNEIEKIEPDTILMVPMLANMNYYYDRALPKPGYSDYIMTLKPGERYYDDNQWIGITSLDAYARTKKKSYLTLGKSMYDFMMTAYDNVLGGGLYWVETSKGCKNTCSNGPGVLVALQMYQATKQKSYLDTALILFNWTNKKLQAPSKLYYDNINTKNGNVDKVILSYNTGTMLQSNIYLYEITRNKKYLKTAIEIADASLPYFYGGETFRDGYWFNAVMLRAYQHLLKYDKDKKYILGFKKCLDHALLNEKNEQGLFVGKNGVYNLVEQGGMLEILARFTWLEKHHYVNGKVS